MSFKSKALAAAATLTMVGGLGAVGATAANAATPSCGRNCIDIYSPEFGSYHSPNFALDVLRQGEKVGQPIIMFRTANNDPALDFTVSEEGPVSAFASADLVSPALALEYSSLEAYEVQYSPYGVDSGLCIGVPVTASPDIKVALEPCGVSSKTVWVLDTYNFAYFGHGTLTAPLINGSDTNFSDPYVLTYPASSYPTDMPRPQLAVEPLTGFSHGSPGNPTGVNDNQLWGARFGVVN
jgi:hypothetical protein